MMVAAKRTSIMAVGLVLIGTAAGFAEVVQPQPKMGEPLDGLTDEQLDRFYKGLAEFQRTFLADDGLGPIFNQDSCDSCHSVPTAGGTGTVKVTRFGQATKGGFDPLEELGGSLLQSESLSEECKEFVPEIANVEINRVTNGIFGDGLIEAIPDADLLANEQEPPGVSGRAHIVGALEEPGVDRVGRFGWKAQLPTVLSFSGDATLNEMGITNRLVSQENAPNGDAELLAMCDTVPDPEDGPDKEGFDFIDRVTDFQRFMAPPPQTPKSGMSGEAVFISVGCADCHIATPFVTGDAPEGALSGVPIKPYSDFLIHDMGLLGDGIVQGDAGEFEIRTPPLWGLRTRDPILHDGRFEGGTFEERIAQAILEHSLFGTGEAADSVAAYEALSFDDQTALVAFLDSLGQAEFDHNGDNIIDASDLPDFQACFSGEGDFYTPDDPCAISDIDQDGDVDCDDWQSMKLAWDGPEWCDGDANGDGVVDPLDAGAVLARFGQDPNSSAEACQYDVNNDGAVDPLDTGFVLARFGACE